MKTSACALGALLLVSGPAFAQETTTVVVTVSGVEVGKGKVTVGICDTGLGGEHCPVGGKQESTAETLEFVFENVPVGKYAFGGHQDLNNNGERDENFLGIPKEPVALSNGAMEKMIPTFADAQIQLSSGGQNRIPLQLQMYGGKKAKAAAAQ